MKEKIVIWSQKIFLNPKITENLVLQAKNLIKIVSVKC
jgi:hypothetical protein